jgi:hypothetical protein
VIIEALYSSFSDGSCPCRTKDIVEAIKNTVPLAIAEAEKINALRDWLKEQNTGISCNARFPVRSW